MNHRAQPQFRSFLVALAGTAMTLSLGSIAGCGGGTGQGTTTPEGMPRVSLDGIEVNEPGGAAAALPESDFQERIRRLDEALALSEINARGGSDEPSAMDGRFASNGANPQGVSGSDPAMVVPEMLEIGSNGGNEGSGKPSGEGLRVVEAGSEATVPGGAAGGAEVSMAMPNEPGIEELTPRAALEAVRESVEGSSATAASATTELLPGPDLDLTPAIPTGLSLQEELNDLTERIAVLLRQDAERNGTLLEGMTRVAVLELLSPGVFDGQFGGSLDGSLPPQEAAFVEGLRRASQSLYGGLFTTGPDVQRASEAVESFSKELSAFKPMTIPTAALCTDVGGFGIYRSLRTVEGRYRFLAGEPHRVIVYVELEDFTPRPVVQDEREGYLVDLEQELRLFHAGTLKTENETDLLAWRRDPELITDFSRRERRDFFIVQIIDLPSTLSVGSYRMQITVRDRGATPTAESQAIINIDVVADPSALRFATGSN